MYLQCTTILCKQSSVLIKFILSCREYGPDIHSTAKLFIPRLD